MEHVIKLGNYKGVASKREGVTVTREEILDAVNRALQTRAALETVTDRPAQLGDVAVIDYKGYIDFVAFEGGEGKDFPLELGSHSFIDTFEDQIVGAKAGDELKVRVNFPLQYHAPQYAGKAAMFEVTVKEIKTRVVPEFNEEFVKADTNGELSDPDEYLKALGNMIYQQKLQQAEARQQNGALLKVVEASELEVSDEMVNTEMRDMLNDLRMQLQQNGLDLKSYLEYMGLNQKDFMEQIKPEAKFRASSRLVLCAIAEQEGIEVSDDEVNAELKMMGQSYGIPADKVREMITADKLDALRFDIKLRKAYTVVVENMVEE